MPTPVNPETIEQAIIAQLSKIKRANGYDNDVQAIYRIDLLEDQVQETALPALFVLADAEGESFEEYDAAVYVARLPIFIVGMVNETEADLTQDARVVRINSLQRDVRKALLEDPTFGKACKDSVLHRVRKAIDSDRGFARFGLEMHATYHFDRSSL